MRSAFAAIPNGADFEVALSYAVCDVELVKPKCGGFGSGRKPKRKAFAIGPSPPKGSTIKGRKTVLDSFKARITISPLMNVDAVLTVGPLRTHPPSNGLSVLHTKTSINFYTCMDIK